MRIKKRKPYLLISPFLAALCGRSGSIGFYTETVFGIDHFYIPSGIGKVGILKHEVIGMFDKNMLYL